MISFLKRVNKWRIKFLTDRDVSARRVNFCDIYLTNRCNSRCLTCHIWQQENKIDLPLPVIN